MSVRCFRLARLLKPYDFETRRQKGFVNGCAFVRSVNDPSLYQQIDVGFAGRNDEAVFAYLAISVTKHLGLKGLSESRLLMEIAQNKERGWTETTNEIEALAWEQCLIEVAPVNLVEFADQTRQSLLERTAIVRRRSQVHLSRLNSRKPITRQIEDFYGRLPTEMIAEAKRLAAWPGVLQIYDADALYLLASLAVVDGNKEDYAFGTDPLTNQQLMWEIQLVADGILCWNELHRFRETEL